MIAFTYDFSNAVGQVRLYSGDTDPGGLNRLGGDRTRTDDEIRFLLSETGSDVVLAAAMLLETKAREYATQATRIQQGGITQDFTARSAEVLKAAQTLRFTAGVPLKFNPPDSPDAFTAGTGGTMTNW